MNRMFCFVKALLRIHMNNFGEFASRFLTPRPILIFVLLFWTFIDEVAFFYTYPIVLEQLESTLHSFSDHVSTESKAFSEYMIVWLNSIVHMPVKMQNDSLNSIVMSYRAKDS